MYVIHFVSTYRTFSKLWPSIWNHPLFIKRILTVAIDIWWPAYLHNCKTSRRYIAKNYAQHHLNIVDRLFARCFHNLWGCCYEHCSAVKCHKLLVEAECKSIYISHIMWDVITYPCPRYPHLVTLMCILLQKCFTYIVYVLSDSIYVLLG